MSIHIQLEKFEGPLGLLLYLIRKEEMDIFDINVHHITQQYLSYIKAMKKLDLEVAGEFVAMAATLLQIKSKMLLPQYDENGEEVEAPEDPRRELVQKLVEYQQFKEVSGELYSRPLLGRDVYTRGRREDVDVDDDGEVEVEENPLFGLIRAYRFAVKNMKKAIHKVGFELQSIAERVMEIAHVLKVGETVLFRKLITATENVSSQILITFLSMLEVSKLGYVSLYQSEPLSDIHIRTLRELEGNVIEQNDAYSYVAAENIMENTGSKIEIDMEQISMDMNDEDDDEFSSSGIKTGENVQMALEASSEFVDQDEFETEAATDEEIEAELNRIENGDQELDEGLEASPKNEVEA